MWWIIVGIVVVVYAFSYMKARRIRETALLIVHPWNAGSTEAEIMKNYGNFNSRLSSDDLQRIIAQHMEFYQALAKFLSESIYGKYFLLEEEIRVEKSTSRVSEILGQNNLLGIFRKFFPRNQSGALFSIPTVYGKSTPANGKTWQEVARAIRQLGVRRIEIVGWYLGIKDDAMVYDPKVFGNFCVNEAFVMLASSELFKSVIVRPALCYTAEAVEKPEGIWVYTKKPKRDRKTRTKKKKR